ncbi:MAG: agmatinase, partial [Pseudomonadota bacterium]
MSNSFAKSFNHQYANTFSHVSAFARAMQYQSAGAHNNTKLCDWAIIGLPFDVATTNRPGARFGPTALRQASSQLESLPAFPYHIDPFKYLRVLDYGDLNFNIGHPQNFVNQSSEALYEIIKNGTKPFSLGGDHFITYPVLKALYKKHGMISLIHFDAHQDTWPDDGQELNHGTMFERAANEGIIDAKSSIQIGIRTSCPNRHHFNILYAHQIHQMKIREVVNKIIATVGRYPVYLTFDIDCLDPAFAPGTGTPVCGGLSSAQTLSILNGIKDIELIGADL